MSYTIEPIPLKEFIKDNDNYRLPRYQRQERWDPTRNFELAISIFQNYPIGVVIVDERKGQNWLLDGRQRRNALEKIVNDPTTLYWWARKCIRFSNNSREEDVYKAFWNKIGSFAQKDEEKDDDKNNDPDAGTSDDAEDNVDDEVVIEETGKIEKSQRARLGVLLDLILMVHKCKLGKEGGKWEDTFDFRGGNINTGYCSKSKGIDIPLLKDFIIKYANSCEKEGKKDPTEGSFRQYCEDTFNLENNAWLENAISSKWDRIRHSILAIKASDQIFDRVQIGAIKLKNVAFFDSLNIFSRVNSKGVPLKVEELLSANPFWNDPVKKVDPYVKQDIREMYKKLELTRLDDYVRWDVVATLIPRLSDKLVLKQDEDSGNFLGFKLLSSIYANGMSKRHLTDLEQKAEEMFGDDGTKIDELVDALKTLLDVLQKDDFFMCYTKGKKTLLELLGHAPALEFITTLYRSWDKKGRRKYEKDSEATMVLQREARILFDRLVYEQLKGVWKGSGDSRMSRHIVGWEARLAEAPISYSEWEEVIISACRGTLTPLNVKMLTPVLYYSEALRDRGFPSEDNPKDEPYDVDHIFPQKKLKNKILNKSGNNKDCLANLELLSQSNNRSKSDTRLNELDKRLKGVVARATGLRQEDIEDVGKYSDPDIDNGFKRLTSDREEILLELFRTKRSKLLGIPEETLEDTSEK